MTALLAFYLVGVACFWAWEMIYLTTTRHVTDHQVNKGILKSAAWPFWLAYRVKVWITLKILSL